RQLRGRIEPIGGRHPRAEPCRQGQVGVAVRGQQQVAGPCRWTGGLASTVSTFQADGSGVPSCQTFRRNVTGLVPTTWPRIQNELDGSWSRPVLTSPPTSASAPATPRMTYASKLDLPSGAESANS